MTWYPHRSKRYHKAFSAVVELQSTCDTHRIAPFPERANKTSHEQAARSAWQLSCEERLTAQFWPVGETTNTEGELPLGARQLSTL